MKRILFRVGTLLSTLIALALSAQQVAAQQATISGRVTGEEGRPLAGANVLIEGLNLGTNTNNNGNYNLVIGAGAVRGQQVTLVARFIGYKPVRRAITLAAGEMTQDFSLEFDPVRLSEEVVTGVSTATEQKKLAFSVGTVNEADLKETPAVSALGALEGKVAGARVIAGAGEPGKAPAVRLRAATSITGRQDPLIIIDGTITRLSLADINSEDIERIEVIKGAAASSLYGSDAANGVIQIFTRRGANNPEDAMVVNFRNEYGQSFRPKKIPVSEAHAYQLNPDGTYRRDPTCIADATANGEDPTDVCPRLVEADGIADNPYSRVFDHQGDAFQNGNFFTNYLSIGQRRGGTNYNVSFQNTRQEGIMFGLRGYNRQNFRINLDQQMNSRLDVQLGAFYGKSNNQRTLEGPPSPFFALTFVEPDVDLKARNPDGSPYRAEIPDRVSNATNPLYQLANQINEADRTRYTGTMKARYRLLDWLTAEGAYNYDAADESYKQVTPFGFFDAFGEPTLGSLQQTDSSGKTVNTNLTLTGQRDFGRIANTTKVSYVYEEQKGKFFDIFAGKFTVKGTPEFPAVDPSGLSPTSSTEIIRNRNAFLISTFDIMDRYILDGLIRRDESSLFGSKERSQDYYRVSGAWRVTEDFNVPGIDELRLRASRGTAGLRPRYNAQYETFQIVGGAPQKVSLGNNELKPALSTENELGFNLDFLQRFRLEYTFSYKETKDQIMLTPLSAATGYQSRWANAGTLEGRTHEMAFNALLYAREAFQWRMNLAMDRTRQKITELAVASFLTGPSYAGSDEVPQIFKIAAGEQLGVIYGARVVRNIDDLYDDPAKQALSGANQTWSRDSVVVNEEGFVVRRSLQGTAAERPLIYVNSAGSSNVKIGDVNPDFNLSMTHDMTFAGFTVHTLFDWVRGGNIYNGTRQWPFFENRDRVYDQRGKPAAERKPQAYYNVFYNSIDPIDYFVEDGSYVKLKELAVNYTIPTSFVERFRFGGMKGVRVGLVGRNLLTFTNYSGYDPEVSGIDGDPFSFRFDGFTYPNFRTLTGLIEIDF